ncbi:MAG: isomerase [Bacteroidetes bacterium]|nr:MAG: isomerase [Bacteroidota bacterium]
MKIYVVNAFTKDKFGGNPAAIVPLSAWIQDSLMQKMAAQHNLSETAFLVPKGQDYEIRWFTPEVEVDLCGHATLASAHVFYNHLGYTRDQLIFHSKSGPLYVSRTKSNGMITLDFPVNRPSPTEFLPLFEQGLGIKPKEVYISTFDYMVVLENQKQIEDLAPDFQKIAQLNSRGLIVTAKGDRVDFVSRGFFPQSGIDEDPVTGSAHTVLVPYWAEKLGKSSLTAVQLSARKGLLECELVGKRVLMSGHAVTYLVGEIQVGD